MNGITNIGEILNDLEIDRDAWQARAEAAEKRVKELESQLAAQAWRPVTEPPDKKGSYLLAYDDRNAYCLGWWHGKDSIYGWGRYGDHATHWQPLPAPPQDHFTICSECHRHDIPVITLGDMDSRGFFDQESGADLCADCLRKALAMLEEAATE